MDIQKQRELLFDNDFKPKIQDKQQIVEFCAYISQITGVQCCTHTGRLYECLPNVYRSAVNEINENSEVQDTSIQGA